jgi:hypothetical protein
MSYSCPLNGRILERPCTPCGTPKACEVELPKGVSAALREIKAAGPSLVTVPQVPVVMAGVEYQLSTGPATFTPEDVMDFVASQDDPAVVPPRLKIGHTSVLSNPKADGILKDGDDGVPALGKVVNIFYDEPSMSAIGDYVGVPRWLAEIMPIAYPNRSIEGFQEAQTVTGHTWGLVVHAVALLGVVWPGVSTLDDLPLLYGETAPDGLEVVNSLGEEIDVKAVAASRRRPTEAANEPVAAAVNVEDVRRAYYDSLEANQMWWWIRAIYIDPNELIVDDDEGQLYRVAYTVNGEEVEFAEAQEVRIQYVDAANSPTSRHLRGALATALAGPAERIAASYTSREESRPNPTQEGSNMNRKQRIAALRARLGLTAEQLPDDATDAAIAAATLTAAETEPGQEPGAEPGDGTEQDGTNPDGSTGDDGGEDPDREPGEDPDGQGANASIDPAVLATLRAAGLSVVPTTQFESVARNAQEGARVAVETENGRRDTTLAGALREGRIRPADSASMLQLHASAATRPLFYQLLTASEEDGGLRPGLVPVEERGEVPNEHNGGQPGEVDAATYDASWLHPAERARIDAIKAGTYQPPQFQTDDPRVPHAQTA